MEKGDRREAPHRRTSPEKPGKKTRSIQKAIRRERFESKRRVLVLIGTLFAGAAGVGSLMLSTDKPDSSPPGISLDAQKTSPTGIPTMQITKNTRPLEMDKKLGMDDVQYQEISIKLSQYIERRYADFLTQYQQAAPQQKEAIVDKMILECWTFLKSINNKIGDGTADIDTTEMTSILSQYLISQEIILHRIPTFPPMHPYAELIVTKAHNWATITAKDREAEFHFPIIMVDDFPHNGPEGFYDSHLNAIVIIGPQTKSHAHEYINNLQQLGLPTDGMSVEEIASDLQKVAALHEAQHGIFDAKHPGMKHDKQFTFNTDALSNATPLQREFNGVKLTRIELDEMGANALGIAKSNRPKATISSFVHHLKKESPYRKAAYYYLRSLQESPNIPIPLKQAIAFYIDHENARHGVVIKELHSPAVSDEELKALALEMYKFHLSLLEQAGT